MTRRITPVLFLIRHKHVLYPGQVAQGDPDYCVDDIGEDGTHEEREGDLLPFQARVTIDERFAAPGEED